MADNTVIAGSYTFRGAECGVTMEICNGSKLTVEVEDRLTADQWRASFDSAYIEDLTRKTGNYKQFKIFVNMLESAITQSSDSVSLDLLTYSDLEQLRSRKTNVISSKHIPSAPRNPTLNSKRYLILTYTVEFDRIHYPLPLPYMGKPDPKVLQETIRQLRDEIKSLRKHGTRDYRTKELDKLRTDCDRLSQEKEIIEAAFVNFRREVQCTKVGSAAKEVRILKEMVKNLEEDLMKERSKHTRTSTRRNQEHRQLLDELEEVKASERTLRARVKSLTNELAIYKRRATHNTSSGSRGRCSVTNGVSSSRESSFSKDYSRHSRLSTNNSYNSRNRSLERSRERSQDRSRERSQDRPSFLRGRSSSRERSLSRERSRSNTSRGSDAVSHKKDRPPSPGLGPKIPRFNPSAYVKEKQRKVSEMDYKKKRTIKSRMYGGLDKKDGRSPNVSDRSIGRISRTSRPSSVGSMQSRTSSVESLSDLGMVSDSSEARFNRKAKKILRSVKTLSNAWSSPDVSYTSRSSKNKQAASKTKKILSSTPENSRTRSRTKQNKENISRSDVDSDYFNRSTEIGEIDARLNRLQQFMKHNL